MKITSRWPKISKLGLLASCLFFSGSLQLSAAAKVTGDEVYKIFQEKCFKCHAGEKDKGDYRLDNKVVALEGGESGDAAIVAGKPDKSYLFSLIMLPHDDDDVMPPEGKGELSKAEKDKIKAWIEQGAPMPKVFPKPLEEKKHVVKAKKLSPQETKVRNMAIAALKKAEVYVAPIAMGMNELRVNMAHGIKKTEDKDLELLKPLAPYITELNLARSNVSDAGVKTIASLNKLEVLDLSSTKIGDASMGQLCKLSNLQRLNLHHTNVTDAQLGKLKALKNLKKLYLWNSKVTKPAAVTLHKAIPSVVINLGSEEVKTQSVVKKAAMAPKPAKVTATPAVAVAAVDFKKHIMPIIEESCVKCHKAPYKDEKGRLKKPKAGLRLDTVEMIKKGSEEGPVIVAGKPEDSTFYTLVALDPDHDDIMPPKGDPLTKQQIEMIKNWIASGAKF
jgi:cytochrome c5